MYADKMPGYAGQTAPMTTSAELEIPSQANQLEASIQMLANAADELCIRLNPIRRQTGSAIGHAKDSPPEPVMCPMANMLRETRRRVDAVTQQLNIVRSELEV